MKTTEKEESTKHSSIVFITPCGYTEGNPSGLLMRGIVEMDKLIQQITSAYGDIGRTWLQQLPHLIDRITSEWNLRDPKPYPNLSWNYVAHCTQDNREVVLKISCDYQSLVREVRALKTFQKGSAVEVLQFDKNNKAVLLEAAVSGKDLMSFKDMQPLDAVAICCKMAQRLRENQGNPKFPFETISDLAFKLEEDWPLPIDLLLLARKLKNDLPTHPLHVIHGDLHRENLLAHGNEWRAIDPKGFVGSIYDEIWPFIHDPKIEIPFVAQTLHLDETLLLKVCFVRSMMSASWGCEDGIDTSKIIAFSEQLYQLLK